ncbi:MAG: response regulator [Flavisolibacter sp.]
MNTHLHILHADDDPEDRTFFEEGLLLCDNSIRLTQFDSGLSLLKFIKETDPFLTSTCSIVCDLKMPMIDGLDVLKSVRKDSRWAKIPVIILSTSSHKEHINACMALGASAYFSKPSTLAESRTILTDIVSICQKRSSH